MRKNDAAPATAPITDPAITPAERAEDEPLEDESEGSVGVEEVPGDVVGGGETGREVGGGGGGKAEVSGGAAVVVGGGILGPPYNACEYKTTGLGIEESWR
jgi:hypothetical protein